MVAPLRILIVDDEPLARARLRGMLEGLDGVALTGEAGSAGEARQALETGAVDVLLLDIQLPGEDGFELLRSLERRPAVVFVTAFDQYAVQAFEENAVDYLLKPFTPERLAQAVDRARHDLERPEELSRRLAELLGGLDRGRAPSPYLDRFAVRVGTRQVILRADEVMWFGAEDKLVFAATAADRHYVNFTLDQLERKLDPARFARVHRAYLVNLKHAVELRAQLNGTAVLIMRDDTEIPVARRNVAALRRRLHA